MPCRTGRIIRASKLLLCFPCSFPPLRSTYTRTQKIDSAHRNVVLLFHWSPCSNARVRREFGVPGILERLAELWAIPNWELSDAILAAEM